MLYEVITEILIVDDDPVRLIDRLLTLASHTRKEIDTGKI